MRRAAAGACAGALLVWSAVMIAGGLTGPLGALLAIGVHVATSLLAVGLLATRARRFPRRVAWAHRLLAAALAVGALTGALNWMDHPAGGSGADPWRLADTVYVALLPLTLVALLLFPTSKLSAGSTLTTLLDGAMAGLGLWVGVYVVWLAPLQTAGLFDTLLARTLLYPAADVALLGVAVSVLARAEPRYRRKLLALVSGIGLWTLSDVAYIIAHARGIYQPASPVAVVGEVGLLLICLGAVASDTEMRWSRATVQVLNGLPFVPVGFAWLLIAGFALSGQQMTSLGTFSAVTLVTVVVARLVGGWSDNARLVARLDRTDRLYRALVNGSSDVVVVVSPEGKLVHSVPTLNMMLGATPGEVADRGLLAWVHPDDRAAAAGGMKAATRQPGTRSEVKVRVRHADGQWRWTSVGLHNRTDDDAVAGVVISAHDIDADVRLREELAHAATHDPLTGLGNLAAAHTMLAEAQQAGRTVTLAMVDLDGFKKVNDTHGHAVGDRVLSEVAARLRSCVRETDTIARIGGDEFLVVLPPPVAAAVAQRLIDAVREPMTVGPVSAAVSASVGLAQLPPGAPVDEGLREADLAMYAAKAAGKNRWVMYTSDMLPAADAARTALMAIREALKPGGSAELTVAYQPIVNLADGTVAGVEALARLVAGDGTAITPDVFIPVAEETALIVDVGEHVLAQVMADMAVWQGQGLLPQRVCVNVSRRQLAPELLETVLAAARTTGAPLPTLCLELTESAALASPEEAVPVLEALRSHGVCVALDDFGTGESSLTQLRTLPVDVVKLDRQFAAHAGTPQGWALLSGVVRLCSEMGLKMVTEGVETEQVATALARTGCEWAQGYLYAKPMPFGQVTDWMRDRREDSCEATLSIRR